MPAQQTCSQHELVAEAEGNPETQFSRADSAPSSQASLEADWPEVVELYTRRNLEGALENKETDRTQESSAQHECRHSPIPKSTERGKRPLVTGAGNRSISFPKPSCPNIIDAMPVSTSELTDSGLSKLRPLGRFPYRKGV